ncbi:MAG: PH domain-containing protein [Provencibacterium sp.]|nr:PH domain-containing protein [Provencibacterium sp.]
MEMKKVSRRALLLWRIRLSLLVLVCPFLIALFFPAAPVWTAVLTILWIVFYLLMFLLYYPVKYWKLCYAITETSLIIKCGVFYNRMKAMQLQNIQHVTTGASPLARALGLCSLQVWGAGGIVYIPGLSKEAGARLCGQLAHAEKGGSR